MKSDDVTLYVIPGCPLCEDARQALKLRGVAFSERDVANDYAALRRMYKLTRQGLVPVIEQAGKAVVRPSDRQLDQFFSS